jgi:hypothetical protein
VDQCLPSPVRIEKYYPHPHSCCWLSFNDDLDGCSLAQDTKAHALGAVLGAIKKISEPVTQIVSIMLPQNMTLYTMHS